MISKDIFDDTKAAFRTKSDLELNRALLLFNIINNKRIVEVAMFLTTLSLRLRLPMEGIIKKTIFEQFCGGITEEHCKAVTKEIYKVKVHSILDYSTEGKETEKEFEYILDKKINLIRFSAGNKELPFCLFKPTGIGRFGLWEKISEGIALTSAEREEWERVRQRVDQLCACASQNNVRLYADAEESWIQKAVDDLLEDMMRKYNKDKVFIYNTLQCYRWDRMEYLSSLHFRARAEGFRIGAKIVRGAYLEKENARAKKHNYLSPICQNKEASDVSFNDVMLYCLRNLEDISVFIGTHNEVSTFMALKFMEEKELSIDDERIWFSQLYGMSDNITYNLAEKGYNSAKLVPFGPVRDVIPYLLRRAHENTSVKGQTGRELFLLRKEKRRRQGGPSSVNNDREEASEK